MSDCSPPGVSQMSVNIQLFPLHLTLISLWWHFISLPLAVLAGKRSRENRLFVLLILFKYEKSCEYKTKQIDKKIITSSVLVWRLPQLFYIISVWQVENKCNIFQVINGVDLGDCIFIIVAKTWCEKLHVPPSLSNPAFHGHHTFFVSGQIGTRCRWPLPSSVNLFLPLSCISIQMKTSCQSK